MKEEEKIKRPQVEEPLSLTEKPIENEPSTPEKSEQMDLAVENNQENQAEDFLEISEVGQSLSELPSEAPASVQAGQPMSYEERGKKVESIMSDGLEDEFVQMSPEEQAEFKRVGEETAIKINELLEKAKVKIKKVLDLLKIWLKLIPGANKFFIEQEAKIRADKIAQLKK